MSDMLSLPPVYFRRFIASDALEIALQPSQHVELGLDRALKTPEEAAAIERSGPAWTAIADSGRILACAGFAETFPGVQAVAWAMLAADIGVVRHRAITLYARQRLAELAYRRIELIAIAQRKPCQWALMLGFRAAHVLENFGAASERHVLFEVIRDAA